MDDNTNTQMLLRDWQAGSSDARDRLIEYLHPEIRMIAAASLRRDRQSSLSTGDLINQAVLKLLRLQGHPVADRAHFVALASRLMRNILVDHVRAKKTDKRNHVKVELCTDIDGGQRVDLVSLESALIRLRALDTQLMELVEMRYFGGMTTADVATVMGISERTVKRRWQVARVWLTEALEHPIDHE